MNRANGQGGIMPSTVINLNQERKRRQKSEAAATASVNRVKFGRNKQERLQEAATQEHTAASLDGQKLDRPQSDSHGTRVDPDDPIYHLADAGAYADACALGHYEGTAADRADGFIHFSTAATVIESAAKHRTGHPNLLLIAANPRLLGESLKWETARNGVLFPHLYGVLPISAVLSATPLPLGPDGLHRFPDKL